MNSKSKLMFKQKNLNGGSYYRVDGRWFWRKNPTDQGVLVTVRWLQEQIKKSVVGVLDWRNELIRKPNVEPVEQVVIPVDTEKLDKEPLFKVSEVQVVTPVKKTKVKKDI